MESYKCECGGDLIFETKKTFVVPDRKNCICKICKSRYVLENGKLIKKGK